jgi:FtsH-binding integral membrane protein
MENNIFSSTATYKDVPSSAIPKTFLANVFAYMTAALAITGIIAYVVGGVNDGQLFIDMFFTETGISPLFYVVLFAPIGLVMLMSFAFNKLSSVAMLGIYILYSALMGLSMGAIFLIYTMGSISSVFFITAGTFGIMAVIGYTTKTDLTKMGSILTMALIGLVIASIVTMLIPGENPMITFGMNCLGVVIFCGLTAYDMQKLKNIGAEVSAGTEQASKMAIMGALALYLDFINLFMFLLRLFGDRK